MNILRRTAFLLAVALLPVSSAAEMPDIATMADWTTGNGYRGWDGKANLDWGKHPDWGLNGGFAWAHSHGGTETLSKQVTLGFSHTPDDNWSLRGTLTAWRDYISDVRYAGPSWGVTYLVNEAGVPKPGARHALETVERTRYTGDQDPMGDLEPAAQPAGDTPDEIFGASFDNDLFFYHAPQTPINQIVLVRGKPVLAPPTPTATDLSQWHPEFEVEKPLLDQRILPSLTFGHYFYTRDPAVIEQRSGQSRFAASAGSLSSLAGGLFKNDVTPAIDFTLPWHSHLRASLAMSQSATDNNWAITQELAVRTTIAGRVRIKAKWDHTIQYGSGTDQYTVGLTLLF
jgi:hypothetical protein